MKKSSMQLLRVLLPAGYGDIMLWMTRKPIAQVGWLGWSVYWRQSKRIVNSKACSSTQGGTLPNSS
jgi:hypothetical protein